jgi:hypothetical protein
LATSSLGTIHPTGNFELYETLEAANSEATLRMSDERDRPDICVVCQVDEKGPICMYALHVIMNPIPLGISNALILDTEDLVKETLAEVAKYLTRESKREGA